jgi:hypothetical protein
MPDVQILHAIPGRIRFRMSQVKGNPTFAKALEQTLARMQMIKWSKINARTGSVLIGYDEELMFALSELQAGKLPEGEGAEELLSLAKVLGLIPEEGDLASLADWIQRQTNGAAWTARAAEWWQRIVKP